MSDRCPCGDIILADTEDWETPLCYECYTDLHEGYSAMAEKLRVVYCANAVEHDVRCEGLEIKHTDALKLIEEMAGALHTIAMHSSDAGSKYTAREMLVKFKGE